ncbi:MAG: hypothetical protein RMM98_03735 [Acidobacteriota bacterium]|nr:hypothetical protein [Blastocatellia bacterium]MDW8238703.1 hypothetical protein [Acidobacteriota bacterium]
MKMLMKVRYIIVSAMLLMIGAGPLAAGPVSSSPTPVQSEAENADVAPLVAALMAVLEGRASQYRARVDTVQAKLFQIGETSAVIAPVTELSLTDLGLLGILEVAGNFKVRGTDLPAGSYRMELGGTLSQMQLHFRNSFGQRVMSIPVEFYSNVTFNGSGQAGASALRRPPLTPLRVIGPNVNINFNLTRTPPYVSNVNTCIGFFIPFSSGTFTIRFCF